MLTPKFDVICNGQQIEIDKNSNDTSIISPDKSTDCTVKQEISKVLVNGEGEKVNSKNSDVNEFSVTQSSKNVLELGNKVKRQILRSEGVYVEGYVQGYEVNFTVDTGAVRTVLSVNTFNKIPLFRRPDLVESCTLSSADGKPIQELGKAIFEINLGDLCFETELIVANIEDEALLGLDILMRSNWGPADISLKDGNMMLGDHVIPCTKIGHTKTEIRKIYVAENYEIPPQSEVIIDVFVDRNENDLVASNENYLLEPNEHFSDRFSLIMAPSLVDLSCNVTCKARILNPNDQKCTIYQDTIIGTAEPITSDPTILFKCEDTSEVNNYDSMRQLKLNETKPVKWETNEGIIRCLSKKGTADGGKSGNVPSHLYNMYENIAPGYSQIEKQSIADLLVSHSSTFSKDDTDLGRTNLIEFSIDTGDAKPIKQPPRRVPLAFANEEKVLIEQMEKQGIIRKSTSPWSSPLVLVLKKNGKVRACVDYRMVNSVSKKWAWPLPRIQDCLDSIAGASIFSTFDLTSGFNQIPVKEEDIPKTAFVTKYGLHEYTTLPFGLSNGPACCQRLMELVLNGLQWQILLIYLDDTILFASSFEEHLERLKVVLDRIKEAGLKLKPEKCRIFQKEVTFLGHVVSEEGVKPDPNNIAKILQCPVPKTVKEVRHILGMGSYYRRYISHFSELVKPLTELTKKSTKFVWSNECQEAFGKLKQLFVSPGILAYPRDEGEYILDTDASDDTIGAVLQQVQDGMPRVIAYGSRTLNKAERNYCITDKELLAVRYFVEYYRQYLLGRTFTVRTDHQALIWLFSLKEPKGRIARWIEILSAFDFSIVYRQGTKHGNADFMSRCANPRDCDCPLNDNMEYLKCGPCKKCTKRSTEMFSTFKFLVKSNEIDPNTENTIIPVKTVKTRQQTAKESDFTEWSMGYSHEQLKEMQSKDDDINPILQCKISGSKIPEIEVLTKSPATRHYFHLWDSLVLRDGILYKQFNKRDGTGNFLQFLTPSKLKSQVLHSMHDSIVSGHLGKRKTTEKLLQWFYWFELREDVRIWILKCSICSANKPPAKTARAPLGSMPVGAPWDRLATDIMGPFPLTPRGNRFILTITDYFTKWVEVFAIPDQTAATCADIILNEVICRYGCPLSIHSDQGRNYESDLFKELCQLLNIKKTRTSPRNPKGNGQCERFNRTLLGMIKSYIKGEQTNWDKNLGCLAGAYRATPSESTKLTPNLMLFGREILLPNEVIKGDITLPRKELNSNMFGKHTEYIRDCLTKAHSVARRHLQNNAKRRKDYYDRKSNLTLFDKNEIVWYLSKSQQPSMCPKLQPMYTGPCIVTKKFNDINYEIQIDENGTKKIVNHDKLKCFHGDTIPKWMKIILKKSHTPVIKRPIH